MKRALLVLCLTLGLSGCATTTGARWYAPASWFSHKPADNADKASARVEVAQDAAVKAAQRLAHETQYALAVAPASRPVAVAVESNDNAVALLDQAAGPLATKDIESTHVLITGLLSDDAGVRAKAEKDRDRQATNLAEISGKLEAAIRDSRTANDRLRTAFDRENALANELRSQRALLWIIGGVAVLATLAWTYVRFALGGVPNALGMALGAMERKSPDLAAEARSFLDTHLNRSEQTLVAAAYAKAK